MATVNKPNTLAPLIAGMLAWIVPGAGHIYMRRTLRGVIIFVCVNGLFWTGVGIGGTFTVEPLRQRWWFAAQMCAGVSGLAGWHRQEQHRKAITSNPAYFPNPQLRTPTPPLVSELRAKWWEMYSLAMARDGTALTYPADTVARAYSGVAGLLNLMCVFDAVMLAMLGRFGEPPPEGKQPPRPKEGA